MTSSSAPYIESNVLPLNFEIKTEVLEKSINEIVRRHETLRTNFEIVDGRPVQVIHPFRFVPMQVIELQIGQQSARDSEIRRIARMESQKILDITKDCLIRTTLLRLSGYESFLLLNMHHILCDSWSIGLLVWELTSLYTAFSQGKPSPLTELSIQYADYAIWQREWLSGNVLTDQLEYWKKQLADISILQLPTDHPRPLLQTYRGATRKFFIDGGTYLSLKNLSQHEAVTLFMTLLAAFDILLHYYSGLEDIVVGIPISNRNRGELARVIGFFVNTLVLRNRICGNLTFRELIANVRETALAAYAHQDLPFERLVEELHPERDTSRNPLFQVVFQHISPLNSSGVRPEQMLDVNRVDTGTAKFDLRLDLLERSAGIDGFFEYSTDLFEAATIDRMVEHFQRLLRCITANPDQRISKFAIMGGAEESRIVTEWNRTEADLAGICVHEAFEARVEKSPGAPAIKCAQAELTYYEVNRRANQLAHYLLARGAVPNVPIAVCMERCHHWIIAIMAILKVGATYVPLDPALPKQRLRWMIGDTEARLIITRRHWLEIVSLCAGSMEKTLDIDALAGCGNMNDVT
jgi:Condensation domain/AMP-binding enzyme